MNHHSDNEDLPASKGALFALAACALATIAVLPFRTYINAENVVMLYLVGIVLTAARYGRGAAILASVLSFLAYNFFFTQPYYTFYVNDYRDILTLFLLLITGVIAGTQTSRLYTQSDFFRRKEHNTSVLYAMSNALTAKRGRDNIVSVITQHLEEAFDAKAMVWFPDAPAMSELREEQAARWAYEHRQPAGRGTPTLAGAQAYYTPMEGTTGVVGLLGLIPANPDHSFTVSEREMLKTFGNLAAAALERVAISEDAEKNKVEAEGEKLRNALLSAVSHDLRTPLASIKGVISSLLMDDNRLQPSDKKELLTSAHGEVARLERIVSNLLEVTLLESGKLNMKKDYYFIPELVGNALAQVESAMDGRPVQCHLQDDLPAIQVDGLLMEQVLVNLLENAAKYTPQGAPIAVTANTVPMGVHIVIEDHGPGIPKGDEERIFDTFYTTGGNRKGSGLGLAIARGIIQAHGGSIKAENKKEGGAVFHITLPIGIPLPSEMVDAA